MKAFLLGGSVALALVYCWPSIVAIMSPCSWLVVFGIGALAGALAMWAFLNSIIP